VLVFKIFACWVIGSCTLGPLLVWAFFYPASRQEQRLNHQQRRKRPHHRERPGEVIRLDSRDLSAFHPGRIASEAGAKG
jgi:hypothetical protein